MQRGWSEGETAYIVLLGVPDLYTPSRLHVTFFFGVSAAAIRHLQMILTTTRRTTLWRYLRFFLLEFFLVLKFFFFKKAPTDDAYDNEEDNFVLDFIV
jgi:hypothetical protein